MHNLLAEETITLTECAKRRKVATKSVFRWANHGVRGVVLETVLVGGRRFTSVQALERFDRTMNARLTTESIDRGPIFRGEMASPEELQQRAREAIAAM